MRYLHAEAAYAPHPASKGRAGDAPHAFWRPHVEQGVPLSSHTADHPALPVTMNHGRWIVTCPWCGSAQYASITDHWFFCADCGNRGQGWVRTEWPANPAAIELEMEKRDVANRNLDPGEHEGTIRAENEAHFNQIVRTPEERAAEAERVGALNTELIRANPPTEPGQKLELPPREWGR